LRPFKKGAFTIAIAAGLPVLPVTLHGTYQAWPPAKRLVYGGKVSVVIDPPISTGGLTLADGATILNRAHDIIEGRLQQFG
jgi:1-acyl-sn-glycerol-3-phosphate acyltransferase